MSTKSNIAWTDRTWNPVRGCSLVSSGCAHCYAMQQAHRFSGKGKPYEGLTELGPQGPRWTGKIRLVPEALEEPLHWKKPQRIFVNSMSDLFHEDVPDDFIAAVFGVMAAAPQHRFQVLTKRPERMRRWFAWVEAQRGKSWAAWPLPNLWLGVSVEDQATADERIPILLHTPAAVRWISAEPLLEPIEMREDWLLPNGRGLDWVVLGGESGPGARSCDVAGIRSILEQCCAAGVRCFVKQLGRHPWVAHDLSGFQQFIEASDRGFDLSGYVALLHDQKGGDPSEWPRDICIREWPR